MTEQLARDVAAARPRDLLPARLSQEQAELPDRLELVAAQQLGDRCWLAVLADAAGRRFAAPLTVRGGHVQRALPGDGVAEAMVAQLADATVPVAPGFAWTRSGAARALRGERPMGVDQTHESVVVGDGAVVKWSVAAGPSPAPRLLSHLHALGFPDVPTPWGFVEHDGALLAAVDVYLAGAEDGWTWCVAELGADASGPAPADTTSAGALGDLVGRLHVALATPSPVIDPAVSLADAGQVRAWHGRALASLTRAVELVDGPEGERLRARAERASAVVAELLTVTSTPVMHVHGDLHVGQVLRWSGGHAVTDFDGNPVLAADQRHVPEPAARDVAGMLQSLDHVGRVVTRRVPGTSPAVVAEWIPRAQAAFLDAYRGALAAGGRPDLLDERLLAPFAVEQECREFAYAVSHLPRWRYVPDAAFAALFPEE